MSGFKINRKNEIILPVNVIEKIILIISPQNSPITLIYTSIPKRFALRTLPLLNRVTFVTRLNYTFH